MYFSYRKTLIDNRLGWVDSILIVISQAVVSAYVMAQALSNHDI
jgi:hypothetical protein